VQVVIVEVVMVVQMERIVRMVGLDDGRRMVGFDDGRMHHCLHHGGQQHWLDDVVRHTVHHRGALMGNGGQVVVQWLHMVVVRIVGNLRIVMVVAVQETRTSCRQGADGE